MFDAERLLGQMMGGALGLGGTRRGRSGNRAIMGVGLLGLAMAAYEHYSNLKSGAGAPSPAPTPHGAPPPAPTATPPPPPPAPEQRQADALLLLRAMISAANADGHIDDQEREAVLGRAREAGLDPADIDGLQRELAAPWPLAALIATTPTAMRDRVYLAARLAIEPDLPAERAFLDELARGVQLDDHRRAELEQQIAAADA